MVPLRLRDFPDELRPAFESIKERMRYRSAIWDEGTVSATTAGMPKSDAKRLIVDIVSLFENVCESQGVGIPSDGRTFRVIPWAHGNRRDAAGQVLYIHVFNWAAYASAAPGSAGSTPYLIQNCSVT